MCGFRIVLNVNSNYFTKHERLILPLKMEHDLSAAGRGILTMVCARLIGPQSIKIYIRNTYCYQNDRWEKFGNLLTKNVLPAIEDNWKEVYIETFSSIVK